MYMQQGQPQAQSQNVQPVGWVSYGMSPSGSGYAVYSPTSSYYGNPHGVYATSPPNYGPNMQTSGGSSNATGSAAGPGAYAYNAALYGSAMPYGQSASYPTQPSQQHHQHQQQGTPSQPHPSSNYARSRETSAGSVLSFGSAGPGGSNLLPSLASRGMGTMPSPASPVHQQSAMPQNWMPHYGSNVGHLWMPAGAQQGIHPDSAQGRSSYSRGNARRTSRGGVAAGSSGPSRGNSISSSQSTGSFYFPTSPVTTASAYSPSDITYAPEVAYMGSAFYSAPPINPQVSRLHHSPPTIPHTSGTPVAGMTASANTPSPSGSSPLSLSHLTSAAQDTEQTGVSPKPGAPGRRPRPARDTGTPGIIPKQSNIPGQSGTSPTTPAAGTAQMVERSEHVMWVGNVPQDATAKELFEIFSKLPATASSVASADSESTENNAAPAVFVAPESKASEVDSEKGASTESSVLSDGDHSSAGQAPTIPESSTPQPTAGSAAEDPSALAEQPSHGIVSIFPISRSNCAFVNYATAEHLSNAVTFFSGRPVRPQDKRCLPMICRVRKKDDEERAGVAGQRGRGMHVEWVKEHQRKRKAAVAAAQKGEDAATEGVEAVMNVPSIELSAPSLSDTATPTPAESFKRAVAAGSALSRDATPRMSPKISNKAPLIAPVASSRLAEAHPTLTHDNSSSSLDTSSNGSLSYTSTNSSLLRHPAFKVRYFILKSRTRDDLDDSVKTGHWATQPHNEGVLDQAFRLSAKVILIFGANQSGEFYGYARMNGPIRPQAEPIHSSDGSSGGSGGSSTRLSAMSPPSTSSRNSVSPGAGMPMMLEESSDEMRRHSSDAANLSSSGEPGRRASIARDFALTPSDASLIPPSPGVPQMASPQQLTPAEEKEENEPVVHALDLVEHPATWPTAQTAASPKVGMESSRRGATLSPTLLSQTHRPPRAGDYIGHAEEDPIAVANAINVHLEAPEVQRSASDNAADRGVHSADAKSQSPPEDAGKVTPARAGLTSPSLSDHSSLAPTDSASYDARAANQLAMRAIIHNLRLDERESTLQAEELERQLKLSEGQGEEDASATAQGILPKGKGPLGASTQAESLGRQFAIEWLQTKPLPFKKVQHLRNPWRDNRQIKVSRDGTELEPSVGNQLISDWERHVAEEQGTSGSSTRDAAAAALGTETVADAEEED
ncbi:hypothetical protein OC845_001938 [Tilletia horrida]|nr:hypothetical protein OC845_001938 [Tilletia horrida]